MPEFLDMGKHAFYVWWSYGVCFGFMAIEVFLVIRNKKSLTTRLARMARMNRE